MAVLIFYGIDAVTGQPKMFDPATDTALTPLGFQRVLSTKTGIDGTAQGTTDLYMMPAGKSACILGAVIRLSAADSIITPMTCGIGVAAGEDDIFSSAILTGLNSTNKAFPFFQNGGAFKIVQSGEIIKLGIDIGFVATTAIVSVDLIGFYLT